MGTGENKKQQKNISKKSSSVPSTAGRLFYTFGTVFLLAIITVCAMNAATDGRAFQKPAVAASTDITENKAAAAGQKTESEAKSKKEIASKPVVKSGTNAKSKAPADTVKKPVTKKPVNPGEEP